MLSRIFYCICVLLFFVSCSSVDKKVSLKPIQCGLLTFESGAGMKAGEAETVTEMFSAALQNSGRFLVMERGKLNSVIQEQQFQASQNEESAAKTGKVLAMHKLFSGSIGMLGEKYIINIKMIDIETSEVNFPISKIYDDDLEDIGKKFLPELVEEILQKIDNMQKK